MGLTLNFEANQVAIANTEAVTFASVRLAGNQTASVSDAGFYPEPIAEGAPSFGVYTKGRAKFSIRMSLLVGVNGAKPRDTVTRANSDVYTVLTASPGVISGIWQLDAVNLVLAADLRTTGTLKRLGNTQDSAGRARSSGGDYSVIADSIPCRVEPTGGSATDALDRRTIPNRFTAFVGMPLDARAKDQFIADGVTYTVIDSDNPERIDELQSLTLEVVQ